MATATPTNQSNILLEPDFANALGQQSYGYDLNATATGAQAASGLFGVFSFLVFLFLVTDGGAAFIRILYALGLSSIDMEANPEKLSKAKKIIKGTLLALLGSFSLVMIAMATNPDIVRGDLSLKAFKLLDGGTAAGSTAATNQSANYGKSSSIIESANKYRGTSTAGATGTNNGRLACVYAVNEVLKGAGIAPIGNLSVVSMENALRAGRGAAISQASTLPGDIAVEASGGHVGICLNQGCSQVISNRSSKATFTWLSGPDFSPSYRNGVGRFYRVNN